jgi:hypothetical protein
MPPLLCISISCCNWLRWLLLLLLRLLLLLSSLRTKHIPGAAI